MNIDMTFFYFSYKRQDYVGALSPMVLPYIDLTYCIDGEMRYVFGGEELTLHSGDAILYPKGSVRIRHRDEKPALYASFNVGYNGDFVPTVAGVIRKSLSSDTVSVLESVKKCHTSLSSHKEEKCKSLFSYLYYQLVDTVMVNDNPHISNIKRYISEHLTERITLKDIAGYTHLAPQYCCALFSKQENASIFDFINEKRIELAKSLIATSTHSFSDVAELSGFKDYNYFARVFSRVTGMSPHKYLRSINEK